MSGILNIDNYVAQPSNNEPLSGEALQKAKRVKTLGIIALILSILGIFVPFVLDIIAFVISKIALKISREHLVPYEYEKPAYWAYRISIAGIILWILAVIKIVV